MNEQEQLDLEALQALEEDEARKRRFVKIAFVSGGALVGGFILYSLVKNKLGRNTTIVQQLPPEVKVREIVKENSSRFPLGMGSRGELVAMLQNALLAMGKGAAAAIKSTSIRNGKPDGIFGAGTLRALLAAGQPSVIDAKKFEEIVAKGKSKRAASVDSSFDGRKIANGIKAAIKGNDIFAVLDELEKIANVKEYQAVSKYFKGVFIESTLVTSLVNALLSVAFVKSEPAKEKIRKEFKRMNLVERDGKWFLEGLMGLSGGTDTYRLAVTKKYTVLKNANGDLVVPPLEKRKVVGYVIGGKQGVSKLMTPDRKVVYAPSQNLKII